MTLPVSAPAATRYASPTGVANANCPIANPCDLATAVNVTAYGDEVILLGGTYDVAPNSLSSSIPGNLTAQAVTIRGESPFAPPTIRSTPTESAIGFVANYDVTLRDVRIEYLGSNATFTALHVGQYARIERVFVDAGPTQWAACTASNNTRYLNSACVAHGDNATALMFSIGMNSSAVTTWDFEATTRNSTFVSRGDSSTALRICAGNQGTDLLTQRLVSTNSIFKAFNATSTDVALETGWGANNSSVFVAQNSSFSSVTASGPGTETSSANSANGNQSAMPLFVNPAGGNFEPAPNSPTIDAGVDDAANGTLDLATKPRTAGARTDIGAYEFQPTAPIESAYALSGLASAPTRFRAAAKGATLRAANTRPKTKRGQKPIGSLLSFESTDAGDLLLNAFSVLKGRKNKTGKCGKRSRANAKGKRCNYYKQVSRTATAAIAAGRNSFYFTGRWNGKKLRPGKYLLVAKHGGKGTGVPSPTASEAGVAKRAVTIVR